MTTADRAIAIRKKNPCATLQEIGDQLGVTRERVRQILKKAHKPTKHYIKKNLNYCLNCGKETCNKKYCSRNCQFEYTHPLVECDYCHKLFRRSRTELCNPSMKHTGYYCSKHCFGMWRGKHHKIRKSMYDTQGIIDITKKLRLDEHLTYDEIAEHINISKYTLQGILYRNHAYIHLPKKVKPERTRKNRVRATHIAKDQIIADYKSGLNTTKILRKYNIHYSGLYMILHQYKVKLRSSIKNIRITF